MKIDYFKTLKTVLACVFLFACLGTVLALNITQAQDDAQAAVSNNVDYFRDFTLMTPDGEEFTEEDIAGSRITVFNGWAPWCNSCVGEMPALEELSREYESKGLQIVGIVADYYEVIEGGSNPDYDEAVRNSVQATGVTYPIALEDKAFFDALKGSIIAFPTTWIVDSEGSILECFSGALSKDEWREKFDRWLESAS